MMTWCGPCDSTLTDLLLPIILRYVSIHSTLLYCFDNKVIQIVSFLLKDFIWTTLKLLCFAVQPVSHAIYNLFSYIFLSYGTSTLHVYSFLFFIQKAEALYRVKWSSVSSYKFSLLHISLLTIFSLRLVITQLSREVPFCVLVCMLCLFWYTLSLFL